MMMGYGILLPRARRRNAVSGIGAYKPTRSASGDR
jgi:hypothetical protein